MTLKQYAEKYGVPDMINEYGEHRKTSDRSIIFPNGWIASIVNNDCVLVFGKDGNRTEYKSDKKYSVAMCDYNGYFDWSILNQYGAIDGCLYCDNEQEIIAACEKIRFQSFNGFNLFIPVENMGTFLPDVASEGMKLTFVE